MPGWSNDSARKTNRWSSTFFAKNLTDLLTDDDDGGLEGCVGVLERMRARVAALLRCTFACLASKIRSNDGYVYSYDRRGVARSPRCADGSHRGALLESSFWEPPPNTSRELDTRRVRKFDTLSTSP